jgi:hypothetical protein
VSLTCDARLQNLCDPPAVEGGGQVKAELISVGQSGEQSLKRIESAGERASGGLMDLGRQAELLRTGIRTLGGALIGVTTVGGLAALVDRSICSSRFRTLAGDCRVITVRAGLEVDTLTIRIPMRLQRRGGRKLITVPEGAVPTPEAAPRPDPDQGAGSSASLAAQDPERSGQVDHRLGGAGGRH